MASSVKLNARRGVHARPAKAPARLRTWKEVREYFDSHLKPVRFNSKGEPVYSNEDIKKLNVILPDEN